MILPHNLELLRQQITALRQRIATDELAEAKEPLIGKTLEDLSVILKTWSGAEEELLQQVEKLATTQHALETERQRYRILFDFAVDGYLVTDPTGIIQEANEKVAALLQLPVSVLVNQSLLPYVAPEEKQSFLTHLGRLQQ